MRGAVSFEAGGKSYALRLTTNVLCGIEEETGKSIDVILAEMGELGKRTVAFRYLFCRMLASPEITLAAAGDLIDEIGSAEADALMTRVLKLAFPDVSAEGNGTAAAS